MFSVNFYASCFVSRETQLGKNLIKLDWEKAVYRLLFTLANTLKALDLSSATAQVAPDLFKALAILSDTTVRRSAVD